MNKTVTIPSARKKRQRVFLFQAFLVVGFLALFWFSFGQNVLGPQKPAGIPEKLGELPLVSNAEGAKALSQVNRLHGTEINLAAAYIGEYAHSSPYHSGRATVWVGTAENEAAAAELIRRMAEGIEKGGSGFSNLQRLSVAGQEVFQVSGPGGQHFFYVSRQSGERVVWLTIDTADALTILEQAVKTF